jgi:LAS superfamily LD-carboxypeptidase LdcB
MENLGIVGEALKKRILEVSRRLTKEEIDFLAAQGITPRGTGFVKDNKFVSNTVIDGIIADFRGKQATPVAATGLVRPESAAPATATGGADPIYEAVSSINESIEKLFGVLIKPPVEEKKDADAAKEQEDKAKEETSTLSGLIPKFKTFIKLASVWLLTVAYPIYETIKDAVHSLFEFIGDLKDAFVTNILPFFTKVLPTVFDHVKVFFTEKLPEYFELFVIAAKDAVMSILEFPKKVLLFLEDYAINFGRDILGRFEPWLKKVGVDTAAASDALNERQKAVQKEQQIAEKKKQEAEAARKAAEEAVKKEYEAKAKARMEAEAAKKAAEAEKKAPAKPVAPPPAKPPAPATPAPAPAKPEVAAPTAPPPAKPPAPATPAPAPAKPEVAAVPALDSVTKKDKGVNTTDLKSSFTDRVARMAADFYEKTGKKLLITSGFRSPEKQKELWERELSRQGGNVDEARKKVAPPPPIGAGSKHSSGVAIDINSKGDAGLNVLAGDRTKPTGWLEGFGLTRPVKDENWHVQMAGDVAVADNPAEPGKPTLIPGSTKILGDGPTKDVTAQYDAQTKKKAAPSAGGSATTVKDADLIMPTAPVADALATASKRVGVDLSLLYAMAKQESGFNPNAVAKGTGAKGLFQFVNNTWSGMLKQYQSSFPELAKGALDPVANAIAGALYLKENSAALTRKNIPVTATNLYAAHFLGAYGASKLLSSDEKAIAASILPAAAANNKNIFYDKDNQNRPRTIGEIIQLLYGKVGKYADKYAAVVTPTGGTGTRVAEATKAADIKPPKVAAVTPSQPGMAPSQIKTAAAGGVKEQTTNVAAVVRGYKSYFAVS